MKNKIFIFGIFGLMVLVLSCDLGSQLDPNPFEENKKNQDTVNFVIGDIEPASIAGIYANVFGPTCANVGCHDGTFEPDFRTIESSYHSLVYRIPIKNDGSLTYRVDPGNPESSALMKRLDGTIEPKMPIEIEPDSEWWEKSEQYIQDIENWILNGALDMAGNEPQLDYALPSLFGAAGMAHGEWLPRANYYGAIMIPDSVNSLELYFSFDTLNNPEQFAMNLLEFGKGMTDFVADTSISMEIMDFPILHYGIYGDLVEFSHRVQLDLDALNLTGDYNMRVKVQEEPHPVTEIPSDNAFYYLKEYMSFIRTN